MYLQAGILTPGLCIIMHDPCQCSKCEAWTCHFLNGVVLHEKSLAATEKEQDAAITSPFQKDCTYMHEALNALCAKNNSFQEQLMSAHNELKQ
jgi:hypothetical protein